MLLQLLMDNPDSWIVPYANDLQKQLQQLQHKVIIVRDHKKVQKGDILCLLACEKKFKALGLNRYNLVVHESDLPEGKGWSPLTWQVLAGANKIPITLFEANDEIDAGDIYLQKFIELSGNELLNEIKHKQGLLTIELILEFVKNHKKIVPKTQIGVSTYYPRRTIQHSKIDVKKSIEEQFNLLRVCDNERYPAWFEYNGNRYCLKINKLI